MFILPIGIDGSHLAVKAEDFQREVRVPSGATRPLFAVGLHLPSIFWACRIQRYECNC
jgi:hypothetical protein